MKHRYPMITEAGISLRSGQRLKLSCCDCGLVHKLVIISHDRKSVGIAMKRDNRATAGKRNSKIIRMRIAALIGEGLAPMTERK